MGLGRVKREKEKRLLEIKTDLYIRCAHTESHYTEATVKYVELYQ